MNNKPTLHVKDLTNQIFGRLTVIEFSHSNQRFSFWKCLCSCGNYKIAHSQTLQGGNTKSCGCLAHETRTRQSPLLENLTDKKFGEWTVIEYIGKCIWKCQCNCGYIGQAKSGDLKSGKTTSCGCLKRLNISNQKFGKLLALEKKSSHKKSGVMWNCICDCGNYIEVAASSLSHGYVKSCGCALKESGKTKALNSDITGNKYGKLLVIGLYEFKNGTTYWECLCDCGKTTVVKRCGLHSKMTKSCGCLKHRIGSDNPHWDETLTDEERNRYRSGRILSWKIFIFKRDNFTCQITGIKRDKNNKINAHHVFNFKDHKDLRYDVTNGITLLESVHKLFHKLYKRRYNTKEQYLEFKRRYESGEFSNKL